MWDTDSGSYYNLSSPPYHSLFVQVTCCTNPLPPLPGTLAVSPVSSLSSLSYSPHTSLSPLPEGLDIVPLPVFSEALEWVATPQAPTAVSSPVGEYIVEYIAPPLDALSSPVAQTPSPKLQYPPVAPCHLSSLTVCLFSPVLHPASHPIFHHPSLSPAFSIGTLDLHPLTPPPIISHVATPDSPIDYKTVKLHIAFEEACVPTPCPEIPATDQKNVPPAPVIQPPPCFSATGAHPHQFIAVHTSQGEEWWCPINKFYQNSITNLQTVEDLLLTPWSSPQSPPSCSRPPTLSASTPITSKLPLPLALL